MRPKMTHKNIAVLGTGQIIVVVFGTLFTGLTFKTMVSFGMNAPSFTRFVVEYGFWFLVVPMIWIVCGMVFQFDHRADDAPEAITYFFGWLIVVVFFISALNAALTPWLRLCNSSW